MATFDLIEFYGIGHGRDIVMQHAKNRSQSSISLSPRVWPPHDAAQSATQLPCLPPLSPPLVPREPRSCSHSFTNITPEDSVYGLTFGLNDPSPASPNVTSDSNWTSTSDQPSPLRRYVGTHERHEKMALSLAVGAQARLKRCTPSTADAPNHAHPFNVLKEARFGSPKGDSAADIPMCRYVTDVLQAHERLALALEKPGLRQSLPVETQTMPPRPATQGTDSSISLGGGGEDANGTYDGKNAISIEEGLNRFHQQQRERALSHPRSYKLQRRSKRLNSESTPQEHKSKIARRG